MSGSETAGTGLTVGRKAQRSCERRYRIRLVIVFRLVEQEIIKNVLIVVTVQVQVLADHAIGIVEEIVAVVQLFDFRFRIGNAQRSLRRGDREFGRLWVVLPAAAAVVGVQVFVESVVVRENAESPVLIEQVPEIIVV